MNNQTLVIYDFKVLYQILSEIEDQISFTLINITKISELNFKNIENYLIISKKKIKDADNQMIISDLPIDITKLVESINIRFLKSKYNQQSEINLGFYKLNLNSRKLLFKVVLPFSLNFDMLGI